MTTAMFEMIDHAATYPGIYTAKSGANADVHARMVQAILQAVEHSPPERDGKGGKKVRGKAMWDMIEFQNLKAFAVDLFHFRYGPYAVEIADHWVNVMQSGEWSELHVHCHTAVAAVYMLDLGDAQMGGDLRFLDRELPCCCDDKRYPVPDPDSPSVEVRPTNLTEGTMVVFPAYIGHHVTCYRGSKDRPRITIAMNLVSQHVTSKQLLMQEFEKARPQFASGILGRLSPFQ